MPIQLPKEECQSTEQNKEKSPLAQSVLNPPTDYQSKEQCTSTLYDDFLTEPVETCFSGTWKCWHNVKQLYLVYLTRPSVFWYKVWLTISLKTGHVEVRYFIWYSF